MNNEVSNNSNNELNVKSNNNSKLIIVILAVLLIGALGFICYDKFINKEKPPVPTPTPLPTSKNTYVADNTLQNIVLSSENQTVIINGNTINVRINVDDTDEHDIEGQLYINDVAIADYVTAANVYVASDFMFFIGYEQAVEGYAERYDKHITYAIDYNGNIININDNYYVMCDNIRLENGEILVTGIRASDSSHYNNVPTELVIKYENRNLSVFPKNQ